MDMYTELADIADQYIDEHRSRVDLMVGEVLSQTRPNNIDDNDLRWWAWIMHSILDDLVEGLPLKERLVVLQKQMNAVRTVRTDGLVERADARIDVLAAEIRARVSEAKVGSISDEDVITAVEQAVERAITEFVTKDLDTIMSMFDRLFMEMAGAQVPNRRWFYDGPQDKRNREFCADVLAERKAYTDSEVDNLNNHPSLHVYVPPNVKTLCGGYGCRHQFTPITQETAKKRGIRWD